MSKILIVVDMQNDFITGNLSTFEARHIVKPMVAYIKDHQFDRIIATKDMHYKDYLDTLEGKKLPVPHCIVATNGIHLEPQIEEAIRGTHAFDYVFKETFGATKLVRLLKLADSSEIYLCGVCTDICVITNALMLKTYFPNRKIAVLKDLCAGTTPEMHQKALDVMQSCQIDIE